MIEQNTLFYGDNLPLLREHVDDASVDLVYLDPPFNSNRSYNVLFREETGRESEAQITAFEDTWHWGPATAETYHELVTQGLPRVCNMIGALRAFIGENQMMAYLVMMAARLVELHRVLKPTGSLYLHCDPTASHYLKILLDTIFGPDNFRNEFIWQRTSAHSDTKQGAKQAGRIHDVILFYSKSGDWTWNPVYMPYDQSYIDTFYRYVDTNGERFRVSDLTGAKPGGDTQYEWRVKRGLPDGPWTADLDNEYLHPRPGMEYQGIGPYKGRFWAYSRENMIGFEREGRLYYARTGMPGYKRYLKEMSGVPLQDVWDDIPPISPTAAERLGYPTQKPLALLERIILASSSPGDLVLDPFCGCGTAIAAAQKHGRRWIGMDITHLAISLQKYRLRDMFEIEERRDYRVVGEPEDLDSARALAADNRYQFQWWALSLVGARPLGGEVGSKRGKKGKDRGVDGMITFIDDRTGKPKQILVQVKSGTVRSGDIRDLRGTVEREKAALGVFITLEEPTRDMVTEAASAGFYHSPGWDRDYPKLQILTIAELLAGADVQRPPAATTFKQAGRVEPDKPVQPELL